MAAAHTTSDEHGRLLFEQLIEALHAESDALVANDGARLADAVSRKQALLEALAPQARALRDGGEVSQLAREAARLNAVNGAIVNARSHAIRGRIEVLVGAASATATYGANGRTTQAVTAAPRRGASA